MWHFVERFRKIEYCNVDFLLRVEFTSDIMVGENKLSLGGSLCSKSVLLGQSRYDAFQGVS